MKRVLLFITIASINLLNINCSKENTSGNFPPLKLMVPDDLKSNDEVTDYIKSSTKSINEWSEKLEQLSSECQVFADKKESEMTFSENKSLENR
jgi:hypothetical protein